MVSKFACVQIKEEFLEDEITTSLEFDTVDLYPGKAEEELNDAKIDTGDSSSNNEESYSDACSSDSEHVEIQPDTEVAEEITAESKQKPSKKISQPKRPDRCHPFYSCSVSGCELKFSMKRDLEQHVKLHGDLPLYKCSRCGMELKGFHALQNHLDQVHYSHVNSLLSQSKVECPICHKFYKNVDGVRKHISKFHPHQKVHVQPAKLICTWPGCDKWYNTKEGLAVHLSRHRNDPQYKCQLCLELFYSYNLLNRHQEREHGKGGLKICEFCGKKTKTTSQLNQHRVKIHQVAPKEYLIGNGNKTSGLSKNVPVICELCGKQCSSQTVLQTHLKYVHEKKFPFCCEICGKGFPSGNQLKGHQILKHGAEGDVSEAIKNYYGPSIKCPVKGCQQRFWSRTDERLEKHIKKMHGQTGTELRYKCSYCGKEFGTKNKQRTHEMAMHENKETKPFKCGDCGKGFATPANLRIHERIVHKAPLKIVRRKKRKVELRGNVAN